MPLSLPVSLPTCLPASQPPCLHGSIPFCRNASQPPCLPVSMHICLPASLRHCLPAFLSPCLSVSLPPSRPPSPSFPPIHSLPPSFVEHKCIPHYYNHSYYADKTCKKWRIDSSRTKKRNESNFLYIAGIPHVNMHLKCGDLCTA